MAKVTNKHDAPLGVAGVSIGAGKTVEIPDGRLRPFVRNSNAVKTWVDVKLIVIEGLEDDTPVAPVAPVAPKVPSVPVVPSNAIVPSREDLEARATELGISFDSETSDEDLAKNITEAEAVKVREDLEARATELGISFQGNTKNETLVKKITEAEAAANSGQ